MGKTAVVGSVNGAVRKRLRQCLECGYIYPTIETIQFDDFWREYLRDSIELNKKDFLKDVKDEQPLKKIN
jgi:transcriptional regulator NrdR family protein